MPMTPEDHLAKKRERDRLYHGSESYKAKRRLRYAATRDAHRRTSRAQYVKNREKRLAYAKEYRETHYDEVRAAIRASYFAKHAERLAYAKAWHAANPTYNRDRLRANPEIGREYVRRRTALKRGATRDTLSPAQWQEIKNAFDHRCAYCGRKMKRLTQDHITPVTKHGDHHIHNIVPACQSCNSRKQVGPPPRAVQPLLLTIAPERKKKAF